MKLSKTALIALILSIGILTASALDHFTGSAKSEHSLVQNISLTPSAFAQEGVPVVTPSSAAEISSEATVQDVASLPAWLEMALDILVKIPYVGIGIAFILKWISLVGAALTALSGVLMAVKPLLTRINLGVNFITGALALIDKVWPIVSMIESYGKKNKKQ